MSRSEAPNTFSAKVRCMSAEPSILDSRYTTAARKTDCRCKFPDCRTGCRYNYWVAGSLCPSCAGKFLCYLNPSKTDDS